MIQTQSSHDDCQNWRMKMPVCVEADSDMIERCSFKISTAATSQALLRVLGLFAARDMVPTAIRSQLCGHRLSIEIDQNDISRQAAELISEKLRASVLVRRVDLIIH